MPTTIVTLPETTSHLKALSKPSDRLIIEPTEGRRTFATERHLFPGFFCPFFEDLFKANIPSSHTGKIIPVVYQQTTDGDFNTILEPFETLWIQDPLLRFIEQYGDWLISKSKTTIFPFLAGNQRFIARIVVHRGLELHTAGFNMKGCWQAEWEWRYVLPQPVP